MEMRQRRDIAEKEVGNESQRHREREVQKERMRI